jgi:uncharacterized protein (DUF2147 family)
MTRFVAVACLAAGLGLALAPPSHAADISGVWLTNTGDAHIRMARCGAAMCGTIIWLRNPNDPDTGRPVTDSKNPDPSRRSRPLLGTPVAVSFHPAPGNPDKYVGHFYNAEDGHTYEGSITAPNGNELRVEGCLLVFCQTQTWTRVRR